MPDYCGDECRHCVEYCTERDALMRDFQIESDTSVRDIIERLSAAAVNLRDSKEQWHEIANDRAKEIARLMGRVAELEQEVGGD